MSTVPHWKCYFNIRSKFYPVLYWLDNFGTVTAVIGNWMTCPLILLQGFGWAFILGETAWLALALMLVLSVLRGCLKAYLCSCCGYHCWLCALDLYAAYHLHYLLQLWTILLALYCISIHIYLSVPFFWLYSYWTSFLVIISCLFSLLLYCCWIS